MVDVDVLFDGGIFKGCSHVLAVSKWLETLERFRHGSGTTLFEASRSLPFRSDLMSGTISHIP